jgi:uncharacterized protein
MASDVFIDTSGFYSQWDRNDPVHRRIKSWITERRGRFIPVTTEWVIGETCTLFVARNVPHLIGPFLDQLKASSVLRTINPDKELLDQTKAFLIKHVDQGYSFVDCLSFCVMKVNRISDALTADAHFRRAGFNPLLV